MTTIWDDHDVQDIIQLTDGEPALSLGDLGRDDLDLVVTFIEHDQAVGPQTPAPTVVEACLAGIRATEGLSDGVSRSSLGWKKFVVYMTAANAQVLWDHHRDPRASAIGGWVLEALSKVGVEPDGCATALGTAYSTTMGIPDSATVVDPATGRFVVRGGDDGRRLAGL